MEVACPYCGRGAILVDSAVVYHGRSYGLIWRCAPCDAYVGVHRGTHKPFGRLSNADLRHWKIQAHSYFDPLWQKMGMPRPHAYRYLRKIMNLDSDHAHIGEFDVDECKKLITILRGEIYGKDF